MSYAVLIVKAFEKWLPLYHHKITYIQMYSKLVCKVCTAVCITSMSDYHALGA